MSSFWQFPIDIATGWSDSSILTILNLKSTLNLNQGILYGNAWAAKSATSLVIVPMNVLAEEDIVLSLPSWIKILREVILSWRILDKYVFSSRILKNGFSTWICSIKCALKSMTCIYVDLSWWVIWIWIRKRLMNVLMRVSQVEKNTMMN